MEALVEAATAAPSLHNAQPWRFRYLKDTATFELRAALDHALPHSDPDGRALHLGCGAALFNLRVAATHASWRPVTVLLPDRYDPRLLATVRLERPAGPADPGAGLAGLHPAIHRRRTSRLPFDDERVPDPVRATLREAAEAEGAQLHFPSGWHVQTVLDLIRDAEGRDLADPGRTAELHRWSEDAPGGASARDFAGRPVPARPHGGGEFEELPQLALLGTREDRPADWLRAGQAMERVLLVATGHHLSTALSSEALDWSDLRWTVRDPLSSMGQVHVVLRVGYGPPVPATPRRPVSQVLRVE
ncbi:nitroreductase [Streptomyces hoynatensis]|uniref:Nitroreductase n=1 Tax=Streptomyces hoynatensis TaxID=1141874 RepID=A0A3A9ZCJ3_9ACTN|nr:nitroreductase [Streptomyces hoynatensis]